MGDHRMIRAEHLPQKMPGNHRREWSCILDDLPGKLAGARQNLARRADSSDQTPRQRLGRREHPAGQAPLECLADSDYARQEPAGRPIRHDAAPCENEADPGSISHDPDIHRERHGGADTDGRTVDGGDNGLERAVDPQREHPAAIPVSLGRAWR